jgi:RNA polymerase sigma factor (TIGR02999 family)
MDEDVASPRRGLAKGESEEFLALVYDNLRKLAARKLAEEPAGQTLDPTGLVHEAYLRLVVPSGNANAREWNHQGHFYAAAAEAMRRILIERARGKAAARRGGEWRRIDFDRFDPVHSVTPDQLALLDEALERLHGIDTIGGELVKLRYFAGLPLDQAAAAMEISKATAYRHWSFAKAWLYEQLTTEA